MSEKAVSEDGSIACKNFPQEGSWKLHMGMAQPRREIRCFKIFYYLYLAINTRRGFG
jgi:hypothetical protein